MAILKTLFWIGAGLAVLGWFGNQLPKESRPEPQKPIDCFQLPAQQGIDCLQTIQRERKWGEIVRELSR